jgi:hypothetical protein
MPAIVLVDYASRDTLEGFDVGAYVRRELHVEIDDYRICFVCSSIIECRRVESNYGGYHAVLMSDVPNFVSQQRGAAIVNLLGIEAGSVVDFSNIERAARSQGSMYFGPDLQAAGDIRAFGLSGHVISIAADGKHWGKTLLAAGLSRQLSRREREVTVISIERSPKLLARHPNPKSDAVRLSELGYRAKHWMRFGDDIRGVARVAVAEPIETDSERIIIIDNSGASVAPVRADIGIILGDPTGETATILRSVSNRTVHMGGSDNVGGVDVGSFSSTYRIVISSVIDSGADRRYFLYMLYQGEDATGAIERLLNVRIERFVLSESELAQLEIRATDVLVTDDYNWTRLLERTRNIIQVAIDLEPIEIPGLNEL